MPGFIDNSIRKALNRRSYKRYKRSMTVHLRQHGTSCKRHSIVWPGGSLELDIVERAWRLHEVKPDVRS